MYGQQVRVIFLVSCLIYMIHPSLCAVIKDYVKCTEGSMAADPEDCAGYYQCLNAESLRMKCPFGSYFEAQNEVCVVDELGVCPTSEILETCAEGEVQADPANCAGYLACEDGQLVSKTCASGSYFEPTLLSCVMDVNGACVEPPAKCLEGEVKLDPNNCAGYLKCTAGELQEELCPNGFYFQATLETCVQDSEGICATNLLSCNEGEIGFDPEDCAGYRECIRGVVENLKCAPGRYFNVTQADCLLDVEEVCVKSREEVVGSGDVGNQEYVIYNAEAVAETVEHKTEVSKELRPHSCGCHH